MTPSLRILYIGPLAGTCLDRAHALRRLGHDVLHIDLRTWLPATKWIDRIIWRAGGQYFGNFLAHTVRRQFKSDSFDLVYVDNGELVSPPVANSLKRMAKKMVNLCLDDPTGNRDMKRFTSYKLSLPYYDLVAVMREPNVQECLRLGASRVIRLWFAADEISHRPRYLSEQDHIKWDAEVLFLGTWMPERGPLLVQLVELGVPLTIQGAHWQKAPEWPTLQRFWRGGSIAGDDYAKAIQCAKINIGLVSEGNRDQHTTRSLEIPALGSVLCAKRTCEHEALYKEDEEAVFWTTAEECAEKCWLLLRNEKRRKEIAEAGQRRYMLSDNRNELLMKKIIEGAFQ